MRMNARIEKGSRKGGDGDVDIVIGRGNTVVVVVVVVVVKPDFRIVVLGFWKMVEEKPESEAESQNISFQHEARSTELKRN